METLSSHLSHVSRWSSLVMITHFSTIKMLWLHRSRLLGGDFAISSHPLRKWTAIPVALDQEKYFSSGSSFEYKHEKAMINGHEAMSCNF